MHTYIHTYIHTYKSWCPLKASTTLLPSNVVFTWVHQHCLTWVCWSGCFTTRCRCCNRPDGRHSSADDDCEHTVWYCQQYQQSELYYLCYLYSCTHFLCHYMLHWERHARSFYSNTPSHIFHYIIIYNYQINLTWELIYHLKNNTVHEIMLNCICPEKKDLSDPN